MDQSALRSLELPSRLRAEFYWDEDRNGEYCTISIVGDPSNLIKKVTPEVIAQFPREYELYQKTSGNVDRDIGGTPLREVPGVDRDAAAVLRHEGVRNAEELAGLDEQTARELKLIGSHEMWKAANLLLEAKKNKAHEQRVIELEALLEEKKKRGPGRPRKEETDQPSLDDSAA